jgi:hypothetical protein
MPNSVFYEKVGERETAAQGCKSEPFACRGVSYELKGQYSILVGTFGIVADQASTAAEVHWQVLVDGRVEKSGKLQAGATVSLNVPVRNGNLLELRATLEGSYDSGGVSIVWGDAKLQP